jgi:soluble lytic murein transglycosylase-like protein
MLFLRVQLRALHDASLREHVTTQSWLTQSQALTEQTQGLKKEVTDLEHHLSSNAAEDLLFLKILVVKPGIDEELGRRIARNVHHYSALHGRDPNLVLAIIAVESDFNPSAVSNVGAQGLMQVMPQWKKVLGITGDLSDPETSIRYGLQVLGFYMEMYKDVEMALTAYNRGPGPVDAALMRGKDPKNQYPNRVLATYERLKRLSVTSTAK